MIDAGKFLLDNGFKHLFRGWYKGLISGVDIVIRVEDRYMYFYYNFDYGEGLDDFEDIRIFRWACDNEGFEVI